MTLKLNVGHIVNSVGDINDVMELELWSNEFHFKFNDDEVRIESGSCQKNFNCYVDELKIDRQAFLKELSSIESIIFCTKNYTNSTYIKLVFLQKYLVCATDFIKKFKKVMFQSTYGTISFDYINIDNIHDHIKCMGYDAKYSETVLFDPYPIPESQQKIFIYANIEASAEIETNIVSDEETEHFGIYCISNTIIIFGKCQNPEFRAVIKNFCIEIGNFDDPVFFNGDLDVALSEDRFYFSNGCDDNAIMTDIYILQKYFKLFRNYYPQFKIDKVTCCACVSQKIIYNDRLVGKSSAKIVS